MVTNGARRVAEDYARHDAPAEAVALLEHLAATGGPVTRADAAALPQWSKSF